MFKYLNLKILFVFFLLINISLFGQEARAPQTTIRGAIQSTAAANKLAAQFSDYSIYQISTKQLVQSLTATDFDGRVSFELEDQDVLILHLFENDLVANNYQGVAITSSGKVTVPSPVIRTYHGFVEGKPNKKVSLTVGEGFVYGFIEGDIESYYIEPLSRFLPSDAQQFIFYPKSAVQSQSVPCGVNASQNQHTFIQRSINQHSNNNNKTAACKEVELAIAHDFSMYSKYGSDVQLLFAYTIGVMNNVQANFRNVFDNDIEFKIVEQVAPICADCDPWTDSPDAGSLLLDFRNWGNDLQFNSNFDIGQFWTDRDFTGTVVGQAYVGGLCQERKYHVLQDYSTNADYIRVVAAHEIGHNFNAGHNNTASGNIMDPAVANVSSWGAGSIATINDFLQNVSCLAACGLDNCPGIENLTIGSTSPAAIDLNWTANSAGNYSVQIKNINTNKIIFGQIVSTTQLSVNSLSLCTDYEVSVASVCQGSLGPLSAAIYNTSYDAEINMVSGQPINCKNGFYDLELVMEHGGGTPSGFIVDLDGELHPYSYTNSPQTILLENLRATGEENIPVYIYNADYASAACQAIQFFDAPDPSCTFVFEEGFDDCALPFGWTTTNLVPSSGGYQSTWEFSDGDRFTSNYSPGTIDGSCMAYFDDDLYSSTGGVMELITPVLDLTLYETLVLEFDYDFHSFDGLKLPPYHSNNSSFNVEVYDGSSWINILSVTKPDTCFYADFWSCPPPRFVLDLDAYRNTNFQVRFIYDDDGQWAGAVGIDNFKIEGIPLCELPGDVHATTAILYADTECTDADGWTHYWNTNSESLLLSIKKNNDPNLFIEASDVRVGADFTTLTTRIAESVPYVQAPGGWEVLSRFWDVQLEEDQQPLYPVSVRFYYTPVELDALLAVDAETNTQADVRWFKFKTGSGIDPNPANGHLDAGAQDLVLLQADDFGSYAGSRYVEFEVTGFSGGGGGSAEALLPVELLNFEGAPSGEFVQLDWQTAAEINTKQFEIERSTDGLIFESIGMEYAAGNSSQTTDYSFVDRRPIFGTGYYRLRMVDLDGDFSYSEVVAVVTEVSENSLWVAPNPAAGLTTVYLHSREAGAVVVRVVDISGKMVGRYSVDLERGENGVLIDLGLFPVGVYTVFVDGSLEFGGVRVVKL